VGRKPFQRERQEIDREEAEERQGGGCGEEGKAPVVDRATMTA
jgi:hypothetical protein